MNKVYLFNYFLMLFKLKLIRISRFEQILISIFGTHKPFSFVQVGANDGISFDNLYPIVTQRKCTGIVIEPVTNYYQKLEIAYSAFPKIIPTNVCVHANHEWVNIYKVDQEYSAELPVWAVGIASLDPKHHERLNIPEAAIVTEQVQCEHLMTLFGRFAITKLDLLQIDTEGYDAAIIEMLDFSLIRPTVIKFEYTHLSKDGFNRTRNLLIKNGYKIKRDRNDIIAVAQYKL